MNILKTFCAVGVAHVAGMDNIKCVVVGDQHVPKTQAIITYTSGSPPGEYFSPSDSHETNLFVQGRHIRLGVWDTCCTADYDRLRPLSYPQTDVFLICFSLINQESLKNVAQKWAPEIQHHAGGTPFVLVGMQVALRTDKDTLDRLRERREQGLPNAKVVSPSEGYEMALNIGACGYFECDYFTEEGIEGLKEAFHCAVLMALPNPQPKKKKWGFFQKPEPSVPERAFPTNAGRFRFTEPAPTESSSSSSSGGVRDWGNASDKIPDSSSAVGNGAGQQQQSKRKKSIFSNLFSTRNRYNKRWQEVAGSKSKLGEGTFGGVVVVLDTQNQNRECAMKYVKPEGSTAMAKQEAALLMKLNHENIVPCIDSFVESGKFYIVMPKSTAGDLKHHIEERIKADDTWSKDVVKNFLLQVARGLQHAHAKCIVHRDLKPGNILVSWESISRVLVQIADFGLAKQLVSESAETSTNCGTTSYKSPEVINGQKYGTETDIWSTGAIAYELVMPKKAFPLSEDIILTKRGEYPKMDKQSKKGENLEDLDALCKLTWKANPAERPTAEQLCQQIEKL